MFCECVAPTQQCHSQALPTKVIFKVRGGHVGAFAHGTDAVRGQREEVQGEPEQRQG